MGSLYSRLYYRCLVIIASQLSFPDIIWVNIVSRFQSVSNRRIDDLKQIYIEGKMNANVGRLLTFLRLAKELELTEREWNELFQFLIV